MSEDQLRRELALQGKHLEDKLNAEIRRLSEHITAQRDQINAALLASDRAVDKSEASAREQLKAHNDLIRKGEVKDSTYATKDEVNQMERGLASKLAATEKHLDEKLDDQNERFSRLERFHAMIVGGLVLASALGLTTLVKLFSG